MELRDDLQTATAPEDERPSPRWWELEQAADRGRAEIKRRCWIGAAAVAAIVGCLIAFSMTVRAAHPRDEADFLLAVEQSPAMDTVGLSDDDLIREGDFACRWLDLQDRAFWNHGVWYSREGVLARYIGETRPVSRGAWGSTAQWSDTRGQVADAAWSQLCGGTWYWHRPHGPSLGSRGGGGDGGD